MSQLGLDSVRRRPQPLGSAGLADLYAAHRLSLVRLAVLLVDDRSAAEDVVHDAFTATLGRLHSIREPEAALGYLRRAVVNGSRSVMRRRQVARRHVPPEPVPPTGPDERAVLAEEHREVLAALDLLGRRQRELLVLRYWSDLSEAQISETLGISRGAVKSTASRALAALKRALPAKEES